MPHPKANYTLAATLVAGGLTYDEAAAKAGGGITGQSLRRGLARKGVTLRQARSVQAEQLVTKSVTMQLASQASELLKEDFAGLLQAHVSKLKEVKPSSNMRKAKEFVDVLEPFARTAAKVHGWGDEASSGIVLVGQMKAADPDNASANFVTDVAATVTEVATSVKEATSEPDCGVVDTTGGVPAAEHETQNPLGHNPQ